MSREELLVGLTEEQIAKVKACKTQEEVLALAKEEGIELTEEQLEAVSGGVCTSSDVMECPHCHTKKHVKKVQLAGSSGKSYKCSQCNSMWTIW